MNTSIEQQKINERMIAHSNAALIDSWILYGLKELVS